MTGRLSVRIMCGLVAVTAALGAGTAAADDLADFYKGKQMRMIIRSGPGGGYDQYARMLGRHIGKHIPGNPTVLPINMPGGGGITAANHVAVIAPHDGTILTIISQGLPIDQALGLNPSFKADLRTFGWVGNMSDSNQVLVTWHTSKTKTLDDAFQRETTIGVTGAGSISTMIPAAMNTVIGTRFRIIAGYPDGPDVNLAMEREEVEGRGTNPYASYVAVTPQWVKEEKINMLVQVGLKKDPAIPNVPLLMDYAKTEEQKQILSFFSQATSVGRPIATTPEVPKDRLTALRRAFDATLKDPEFIADAQKQNAEISPMTGEELQKLIDDMIGAPPGVLQKVKTAIQAKKGIELKPGAKEGGE
ncbi:MAG TPA: tripartite tricarboxylate transporter substrate-binding protein [Alphaproteobacteria bacterium]|jgi:tripartite-type tricarboxylate transporter receptor subunit TctC|nr:tripartite tricarboxylate transporter substrate-binding protein [Alphaproteobacteria bacterium]